GVSPLVVHNVDNFVSDAISNPEWDVHYANFVNDISNLSFTQDAMVIANNSKHPERALALWDYLTTNEEAFMLFYYGIEGVSYELNDKGEITMIDTDNYNTSSMWAVRNSDYMHNGAGTPEAYDQLKQEWDSTIQDGKGAQSFRSFVVDTSSIQTEYDACVSTHQQYWWPLELGYTDPVSGLAEYQKMMEAAGIEKVREEIQRQLDEYLASMK
ncbi:MAG: ABC transporter substrate-binding protein, partial [Subdoligranulum sp.]|nr:ABC transporter substrate-binding protein [Subdoligranulum sp.]